MDTVSMTLASNVVNVSIRDVSLNDVTIYASSGNVGLVSYRVIHAELGQVNKHFLRRNQREIRENLSRMLKHLNSNPPGNCRRTVIYLQDASIALTFIERLWLALHVYPKDGPLRWSQDGLTFLIDDDRFKTQALDFYRHLVTSGNVVSFIRNLYRYGFRVAKAAINPQGEYTGVTRICFHPQFNKREPALLKSLSPRTYAFMLQIASILTDKVAAGVDPRMALHECLLGDEDYHYPQQLGETGGGEGRREGRDAGECLAKEPKPAISANQMSYHVPLDTSGSCPQKKRRKDSPPKPEPEVTVPSARCLGNKDVDNNESPKRTRMGQNTLEFLQRLSIGNRWRPTAQIPSIQNENARNSMYFADSSLQVIEEKAVLGTARFKELANENASSSLSSLEPSNNPLLEHNAILPGIKKEKDLPMDSNDGPTERYSMKPNDRPSKMSGEAACKQAFISPGKAPRNMGVGGLAHKYLQTPESKQTGRGDPSTSVTHFPRVLMIPHVLTPGGYVPLLRPGGTTAKPAEKGKVKGKEHWCSAPTAEGAPEMSRSNPCRHGKAEVDNQRGLAQTIDFASLPHPIVIEPKEETLTSPEERQDDNKDWKSLTDESDSPRLQVDYKEERSSGSGCDEAIEG